MSRKNSVSAGNRHRVRRGSGLSMVVGLCVLALTGWLAWGCRRTAHPIQPSACVGCNLLLITIDTLRSDRVGAFGGPAGLTPVLDRIAGQGIRLTRAYASAPLTLPSHASILTGVSPPVHGIRANGLFRLGQNIPTLAVLLKSAGYRTGAFIGAFVLDARFGLDRGFDVYDERYGEKHEGDGTEGAERRAEEVTKPATKWILHPLVISHPLAEEVPSRPASPALPVAPALRASSAPWFAWVHLYDPHEPYRAPEPYASQHTPYDAEVAYVDAMIGKLLADLDGNGQLDRTLVVVAADHGESLGEHNERTHGVFVYDVTMRVPWLIWAGNRIAPQAYDGLVRLIDLAPTTLDLLGVRSPQSFEGRSILPALAGRERPPAAAYIEAMDANVTRNWAPLTGIVSDHFKLIDLPIPELYDLARDPHERTNLFEKGGGGDRARALQALLRDTNAQFAAHGSASVKTALNEESRQRLQALGYVGSTAEAGPREHTEADDPKKLILAANDLNLAVQAFNKGARAESMATLQRIMQEHPGYTTAFGMFASMQRATGDLSGAIATLEDIVRRQIADQRVIIVLAGYLEEAGKHARAIDLLAAVIASHPDEVEAYNSLGAVYSHTGRHEEARAAYRKVLELDPTSATAYENLGVDELDTGELSTAEADLKRALDLDPSLAGAHNTLAALYMQREQRAEAIAEWQTALNLNPRLYDALYNLGITLAEAGRLEDARPYLRRFVDEAPRAKYGTDIAQVREVLGK